MSSFNSFGGGGGPFGITPYRPNTGRATYISAGHLSRTGPGGEVYSTNGRYESYSPGDGGNRAFNGTQPQAPQALQDRALRSPSRMVPGPGQRQAAAAAPGSSGGTEPPQQPDLFRDSVRRNNGNRLATEGTHALRYGDPAKGARMLDDAHHLLPSLSAPQEYQQYQDQAAGGTAPVYPSLNGFQPSAPPLKTRADRIDNAFNLANDGSQLIANFAQGGGQQPAPATQVAAQPPVDYSPAGAQSRRSAENDRQASYQTNGARTTPGTKRDIPITPGAAAYMRRNVDGDMAFEGKLQHEYGFTQGAAAEASDRVNRMGTDAAGQVPRPDQAYQQTFQPPPVRTIAGAAGGRSGAYETAGGRVFTDANGQRVGGTEGPGLPSLQPTSRTIVPMGPDMDRDYLNRGNPGAASTTGPTTNPDGVRPIEDDRILAKLGPGFYKADNGTYSNGHQHFEVVRTNGKAELKEVGTGRSSPSSKPASRPAPATQAVNDYYRDPDYPTVD